MAEEKDKYKTTVTIYGQQYTIVGDDPPEHVRRVAKALTDKMKEHKSLNPYLNTTRLAVLTAVNLVDENLKMKDLSKNEQTIQEENEDR
ncbi:cell division protein ZapA [Sinobaca sp. H24]|uniref:cell division protein ZapA n=1 Tax=Sinobaca sp. H24 TaxID=2923376 RepID=UPI00207A2D69|nr:cell division protein ZapA [Sinobaca sp. H24]